jgi:hypothetical protein
MPYTGHPTLNDTLELNAANPTVTGLGFDVNGSYYCIDIQLGSGNSGMKITNNVFNMSRVDDAYGINADIAGSLGTEQNPIIIANNSFNIRSTWGLAFGINLRNGGAGNDIFATITGNDMSAGIWGDYAYGITLTSTGGRIGSQRRPAIVSGNRIIAGSDLISASGISISAQYDVFADVTNNDMSGGIWSNSNGADCIYIVSVSGNLGTKTRPVIVSGNRMIARDNNNSAYGIYLFADGDLFVGITGNEMKVISPDNAYGVYSLAIGDLFAAVTGNEMEVFATDDAYGVYFQANGDLFAAVTGNEMDVFAADDAWGAYLRCAAGVIGSLTAPTLFIGNSGTIGSSSGNNIYLLELDGGTAGSYVNWTGNSFEVFGDVWSGNYPFANGPVYLNGYGGIITP